MKFIPGWIRNIRKTTLQGRFLFKVLSPPFLALLVISLAGFWLLDRQVRVNATQDLYRAASSLAAKTERELAIREAVLTTTGSALFQIKTDYTAKRTKLEQQHVECKAFVRTSRSYNSAPNNSCEPFLAQIAQNSANLPAAVETGYTTQALELNQNEQLDIKDRLDAFVKFFPETLALIVNDKTGKLVSQATNGEFEFTDESIAPIVATATTKPVEGTSINGKVRQAIFAYPIDHGSVVAVYNMDHPTFLKPSWDSTPIDTTQSYAIISNADGTITYPKVDGDSLYKAVNSSRAEQRRTSFDSNSVNYLGVGQTAGKSGWQVAIASPSALVLRPVKDAQIAAFLVIGLLLVSFLWVGTIFVKNTIASILVLAGGAIIFASNNLDHRISLARKGDEEFNQLAETMNTMADRILQAEKDIDQKNKEFINIASHELKAPMTFIIGNLSMILEDGVGTVDEKARELTASAYDGTIRLRNLIGDLLDIARIESGRAQFNIAPLDITSLTKEMINIQSAQAQQNQININYPSTTGLPAVLADKTKLEIVMTNFISNAIKYNRPSGNVAISHQMQGTDLITTISDTGLGIPDDQQSQMFQKFFRVSGDDRRNIPGTGLGMYITKQFIEAMGGRLSFKSKAGQGTAFTFSLPTERRDTPILPIPAPTNSAPLSSSPPTAAAQSQVIQPTATVETIPPANPPASLQN